MGSDKGVRQAHIDQTCPMTAVGLPAVAFALVVVASPFLSSDLVHAGAAEVAALPLDYEIVSRRPHDPEAFTQGLVLDPTGRLFEIDGPPGPVEPARGRRPGRTGPSPAGAPR